MYRFAALLLLATGATAVSISEPQTMGPNPAELAETSGFLDMAKLAAGKVAARAANRAIDMNANRP